jgi:hypothetical protein
MHLWWLLTYRARAQIEDKFPVSNTIYYYHPKEKEKVSKPKLDLFDVNGVITEEIATSFKNKFDYYNAVIDLIESRMH